jgi:hypothetical protein
MSIESVARLTAFDTEMIEIFAGLAVTLGNALIKSRHNDRSDVFGVRFAVTSHLDKRLRDDFGLGHFPNLR